MLQNPVHVVTHLALNKQLDYFSFLDFSSNCYASDPFLKNSYLQCKFLRYPHISKAETQIMINKGDE